MGSVLILGAVVTSIVGFVIGILYSVPFQKWTFQHRGRVITVRNYGLRETVAVDGALQAKTRCDGDSLTWAHHVVSLDGHPLHIGVRSENGVSVHCEAADGSTLVFDSRDSRRLLARATSAAQGQAVQSDPRGVALTALLAELAQSDDPEVMARAEILGERAHALLTRTAQTQRASELHTALGGGQEIAALLATLESDLQPVLAELRALHLSGSVPGAAAPDIEPARPRPVLKATV